MAINGETVLAVIPARGGSKRAPRKNVREFRGVPLFLWSVQAARRSAFIDHLCVSTEDDEVKAICIANAVDVIERPAELATDEATNEDVLRHALGIVKRDWVVLLQPTSPLRTALDIDCAIQMALHGDGCISYCDGKKNGAVYVARATWLKDHDFTGDPFKVAYQMPQERSLDIDFPEQFDA